MTEGVAGVVMGMVVVVEEGVVIMIFLQICIIINIVLIVIVTIAAGVRLRLKTLKRPPDFRFSNCHSTTQDLIALDFLNAAVPLCTVLP